MPVLPSIDHLVLAVPDLVEASERFAAATGVTPAPGGRHVGLGTANRLIGLGPGRYLEIVGPDPAGPAPDRPRPFGIDGLSAPRVMTWAIATDDIDTAVTKARAAGYDPGAARGMSRRTPEGALLSWRLTLAADGVDTGVIPFLIDWGDTPHPSQTPGLPTLDVVSFEVVAADASQVRLAMGALGTECPVADGAADALRVQLATPRGVVSVS